MRGLKGEMRAPEPLVLATGIIERGSRLLLRISVGSHACLNANALKAPISS